MALAISSSGASQQALTLYNVDVGERFVYIYGFLIPSGNYATGGDTLDFTNQSMIPAASPPVAVFVGGSTGDSYAFLAGSALNTGKLKINTASNAELVAGAYPARITGDTAIQFEAIFKKFL